MTGAALFLALGILRAWHHEPWRDECGVWLLANNCESLDELFHNLRYAGHPYLWPTMAWLLAHATTQIFALQLVHLVVATLAVFLVLRHAPWPRWESALGVCGYFIVFEYSIICRAYVFALLGAVLTAIAWRLRADRPWLGGSGLFLLTQSSVYGVILALAFIPLLIALAWQRLRDRSLTIGCWAGWSVPLILGTVLAVVMVIPPRDSGYATGWVSVFKARRLARVVATSWRALVPLPNASTPFLWNSNMVDELSPGAQMALGGVSLATVLWTLRRNRWAALFFLTATLGVCLFAYVKLVGSLRHHGHLYLAFFVAAWLAAAHRQPGAGRGTDFLRWGVFVVQAIAGIWLGMADWVLPFSANRLAAKWISSGNYGDHVIAGYRDHSVSGVGMYLRRPVYFLGSDRRGTFVRWDERSMQTVDEAELFRRAADIGDREDKPVLLILNQPILEDHGFQLVAWFRESLISSERYCLYSRDRPGASVPDDAR